MGLLALPLSTLDFLEPGEHMKKIALATIAVITAFSTAAFAGTIHGKVSGVKGQSVVYVEAVAGKTFPRACATRHHGPEGPDVCAPHPVAIQQGTTVEFLNSDSVRTTSSGPRSAATKSWDTTWAPGPRVSGNRSNSTPRHHSIVLQRAPGHGRLPGCFANAVLCHD
jgi:plastocyanin